MERVDISIEGLQQLMSTEQTVLVDVRGHVRGGFIPTSIRFSFNEPSMPFALEQVASSMAPMVLYGFGFPGEEKPVEVRKRFFSSRGRTFVLEGGMQAYLGTVMDPSTGEPYFGTVMEYEASAFDEEFRLAKSAPKTVQKSPRMVHISSHPSLLDAEAEAEEIAALPKQPSIEEQVSKFAGPKSTSRRPEWTDDKLVDLCPTCDKKFTTTLRKHHCRACGQIFCWKCSRYFIMLPEYDYAEPERVCTGCVRRCSNSDYLSNYTVYEAKQPGQLKVLLFGPELQTRKTLAPLASALSERYTTIAFELPGVGSRDREALTEEAVVETIVAAVNKYAVGGTPVILCGISMSAYAILKALSKFKHRKVFGLVMVNAGKNYYQVNKLLLKGVGALYKLYPAHRLWKFIVDDVGPTMPKEKMEELFLQNAIDYSLWPESAAIMCAPSNDYYLKQIESFKQPVLWIGNKKDGKQDLDALSARSDVQATVVMLDSGRHGYASSAVDMALAVDNFIEQNKSRLIIGSFGDDDSE